MQELQIEGYVRYSHAFTSTECQALATILAESRLKQDNRLSVAFDGSSGIQLVFTRDGIDELQSGFPFLCPFFKTAASPKSNAFFMNTLVMRETFRIKPHLDCSLNTYINAHTTPTRVSVFYVQVPDELVGGKLELVLSSGNVMTITPSQGSLVQFQGNLIHGVSNGWSTDERISVVLEEYDLDSDTLACVPRFSLRPTLERKAANVRYPDAYQMIQDLVDSLSEEERAQLNAIIAAK